MSSPQNLGVTSNTSDYVQLFPDQDYTKESKAITIAAGEASAGLSKGQVLAKDKTTGKYKVLKTAVAKTAESLTLNPTNPNGVKFVSTAMASGPIIPGTVVVTGEVSGVPVTMSDNGRGILLENLNKAMGFIDYGTKQVGINTVAAMVSSDSFTAAYDHFNMSGNIDLEKLAVLPIDIDATVSEQAARGVSKGIVNVDALTPDIDIDDADIVEVFDRAGLRLKELQS
jgi:hypothetical protein